MNIDDDSLNITFSYNKAIEILKGIDDELKPFAVLGIEEIENENDFELLIKHLTNCDGRIRELVAIKLNELSGIETWLNAHYPTLTNAICDINPNVARNIADLIEKKRLKIGENLIGRINEILLEIELNSKPKKWKTQKNHSLNKKFFNLYWCLEGLSGCLSNENDTKKLIEILNSASMFDDYTIREKVAKILAKMENPPENLLLKMKEDDNFYVKLHFYDKIGK